MADEQYRWLDRDTAERLLRGERLDTVDATVQDQAERLAEALGALSAELSPPAPADAELPGEAAALAAFRTARAERAAKRAGTGAAARDTSAGPVDAGLVRIGTSVRSAGERARAGRARWTRPVRLALSAVLAAGAVGGVATAAAGVLPTPFGGEEQTAPRVSAPAGATPGRSPGPSSSGGTASGGPDTAAPGGATAGTSDGDAQDTEGDSAATSEAASGVTPGRGAAGPGGARDGAADRRGRLVSACRDLHDGRSLGADRKHALKEAAGGSAQVWKYCKGVLKSADGRAGDTDGGNRDKDHDGGREGKGGQKGRGGQGEQGDQGDRKGPGGRGEDEGGRRGGPGDGPGDGKGRQRGGQGDDRPRARGVALPSMAPAPGPHSHASSGAPL